MSNRGEFTLRLLPDIALPLVTMRLLALLEREPASP
ncbi:Uncharacterised protein [Paenibacillus thiaminolyticus]|nr:Uncharacterised protein [Paenibacillus thiaminolyticus]